MRFKSSYKVYILGFPSSNRSGSPTGLPGFWTKSVHQYLHWRKMPEETSGDTSLSLFPQQSVLVSSFQQHWQRCVCVFICLCLCVWVFIWVWSFNWRIFGRETPHWLDFQAEWDEHRSFPGCGHSWLQQLKNSTAFCLQCFHSESQPRTGLSCLTLWLC